jgi:spermidine synthase
LFVSGGQGIIVAANRPLITSRAHLQALSARPSIAATLGDMSSLEPLLERVMLSGAELDKFVADGLQTAGNGDTPHVSTDENLYLEYATPKGNVMNYSESIHAMFRRLSAYRHPDQSTRHLAR